MSLYPRFAQIMNALFESRPHARLPRALIACSGGVDSMTLLDLMREHYEAQDALHRLSVSTLDHGQRVDTSRDEEVVEDYCRAHGIKFFAEKLGAKLGSSEKKLRDLRYKALARLAGERRVVFTAHHAQDNLETYLFRIIRGAHPQSLRGIAFRSRRGTLKLARPLLLFTKEDLIAHAHASGLQWNEDPTNRSPRYARNRIRHELLPLLEELRPGSGWRLLGFFQELEALRPRPERTRIDQVKAQILSQDGALAAEVQFDTLKSALDELLGETGARTVRAHWDEVKKHLRQRHATRWGGGPPKTVQFPGGNSLYFKGKRLYWVKADV